MPLELLKKEFRGCDVMQDFKYVFHSALKIKTTHIV